MLRQKNEQLMRKLVRVSRRAQTANRMAHHDVLTGLPNRLLLIKCLKRAIADAFQRQMQLALLFIDLDGFKAVNDRYGHEVGDRLLAVVAARLAGSVRADDIACRFGGDEFVVLLRKIGDPAIATRISRQILENISRRYWIDGHAIHVTASIGLAMYPADGERYDALLSHADAAMYRSKAAPRVLQALPVGSIAAAPESRSQSSVTWDQGTASARTVTIELTEEFDCNVTTELPPDAVATLRPSPWPRLLPSPRPMIASKTAPPLRPGHFPSAWSVGRQQATKSGNRRSNSCLTTP